jgi:hypothetical protein
MARKQGRLLHADRALGWSAFTLGAIPKRVRADTIIRPFTVRFAKRNAFSISGFSNGITAAVSRGCPESEPVA